MKLNTPKAKQIDELFESAIGLVDVSDAWRWRKMSSAQAKAKLDKYVTLRGSIAHRGAASSGMTKTQVRDYFGHVKRLAAKTGGRVKKHVHGVTGKKLW